MFCFSHVLNSQSPFFCNIVYLKTIYLLPYLQINNHRAFYRNVICQLNPGFKRGNTSKLSSPDLPLCVRKSQSDSATLPLCWFCRTAGGGGRGPAWQDLFLSLRRWFVHESQPFEPQRHRQWWTAAEIRDGRWEAADRSVQAGVLRGWLIRPSDTGEAGGGKWERILRTSHVQWCCSMTHTDGAGDAWGELQKICDRCTNKNTQYDY